MKEVGAKVLIVTGSREARKLCEVMPYAIARSPEAPVCVGGFDAVIDATHPCESQTHQRLAIDCAADAIPLLRLRRPAWTASPDDRWIETPDALAARQALQPQWRRIFLALSHCERRAFADDPTRWYLVRSRISDAGAEALSHFEFCGKDNITEASETALMRDMRIDALVTRNAGGQGAWPKMSAARNLGIPVILLARPSVDCAEAATIEECLAWLAAL